MSRTRCAMALLAVVVASAGCGGETSGDDAGGPVQVRVATVPNLIGWSAWGADDLGLFDKAGVRVDEVELFPSGAPIIESGLAGDWDVAVLGAPPAMVAGAAWNLQIAGIQNEEADNIRLYVKSGTVTPDNAKAKLSGEKGLVVGSSVGEQVYRACLEHLGVDVGSMQTVPLEMPQIYNAFSAGEGKVAQLWSEFVTRAEREGHQQLCSGKDAGVEIYTVFVVHPDFAEAHPEAAAAAVSALFEANTMLADDVASAMPSLAKFFKDNGLEVNEEELLAQNELHSWYSADESAELITSGRAAKVLRATAEFLVDKGQYKEVPEFDFFATTVAERAAALSATG